MIDTLEAAIDHVRKEYPLIAGNLSVEVLGDGPALESARRAFDYAVERANGNREQMEGGLEGFAEMSFDFLRLQARFLKTGEYARQSAVGLADELYRNEEDMRGFYLDGLLLTYALWPNHSRIFQFFEETILAAPGDSVAEVGLGHGLMAATLLRAHESLRYSGLDLSPHSLAFTRETFQQLGIDSTRWELHEGDATEVSLEIEPASWFVCCEVLEHVDDPVGLLASCRNLIGDDGKGFISTVANLEASDHVYLFRDAGEIHQMVADAGFSLVEERALPLPGSEANDPLPLNWAGVIAPA